MRAIALLRNRVREVMNIATGDGVVIGNGAKPQKRLPRQAAIQAAIHTVLRGAAVAMSPVLGVPVGSINSR